MQKILVMGLVKSLHDLFTAFWVGGMLASAIALLPALKRSQLEPKQHKTFLVNYQKALSLVTLISVLGLWVTGLLLGRRSPDYGGFLNFSSSYSILISIKHLIILVMVAIALFRRFGIGRRIMDFTAQDQKIYASLLIVNAFLGVVVIFLSAISTFL